MLILLLVLVAVLYPHKSYSDSLGDNMEDFWGHLGGSGNYTPAAAYNTQSAGYYSAGNLFSRTAVKNSNLISLQLPSHRAGCGGIDMFAGSFSFINADELISLFNAIGSNAKSFAFKLALDTLSPQIGEQIAEVQKMVQKMNSMQINSCEQAAALVGGIWPKSDEASKSICSSIGNRRGIFSDYAAAKHGCSNGGKRAEVLNSDDPEYKNIRVSNINLAWKAIKDSGLFGTGSSMDTQLAELFMTLSGTIIIRSGTDDDAEQSVSHIPATVANNDIINAMLEGGEIETLRCDEYEKCLNPVISGTAHTILEADAFQTKVRTIIEGIAEKVTSEATSGTASDPLSGQELALLNMTSVPIYKILNVYSAYSGSSAILELSSYSEIVASDILFEYLNQVIQDMEKATATLMVGNQEKLDEFSKSISATRSAIARRETKKDRKVETVITLINRTVAIEGLLAGRLGSTVGGSLQWQ